MDFISIILLGIGFSIGCVFTGLVFLIIGNGRYIREDVYDEE